MFQRMLKADIYVAKTSTCTAVYCRIQLMPQRRLTDNAAE